MPLLCKFPPDPAVRGCLPAWPARRAGGAFSCGRPRGYVAGCDAHRGRAHPSPRSRRPPITVDRCVQRTWMFYSRAVLTSFPLSPSVQALTFLWEPFCFYEASMFLPLHSSDCIDWFCSIELSAVMEIYICAVQ